MAQLADPLDDVRHVLKYPDGINALSAAPATMANELASRYTTAGSARTTRDLSGRMRGTKKVHRANSSTLL